MSVRGEPTSRRSFLKLLGATALGLGLRLAGTPQPVRAPEANTTSSEASSPIETASQELWNKNGVSVRGEARTSAESKIVIPKEWNDAAGNHGEISPMVLKEAVQLSIHEQRNVVALVQRVETTIPQEPAETPIFVETPKIHELPEDTLSKEELAERGIEIIGSSIVDLHIRAQAFAPGGLLEQFAEGGKRKLVILLSDDPEVSQHAFSDPQYEPYREVIIETFPKNLQQKRQEVIDRYRGAKERSHVNEKYDFEKTEKMFETITPEEFRAWGLGGSTDGYYLEPGRLSQFPDTAFVFLALGARNIPRLDFLVTHVSEVQQGISFDLDSLNLTQELVLEKKEGIHPNISYPNPRDFEILQDYVGFGRKLSPAINPEDRTLATLVRHELSHDWKISHSTGDPVQDWSEYDTDLKAMETIQQAYEKKENEGDDSGYYFVLENKKEKYVVVV